MLLGYWKTWSLFEDPFVIRFPTKTQPRDRCTPLPFRKSCHANEDQPIKCQCSDGPNMSRHTRLLGTFRTNCLLIYTGFFGPNANFKERNPNSVGFRPTLSRSLLRPALARVWRTVPTSLFGLARHDGFQILVYFQSVHQKWGDIPDPKLLPGSPATHQVRDSSLQELGYNKRPRPSEVGDKGGNCEYGDMGDNGAGAKGNGAAAPPRSNLATG